MRAHGENHTGGTALPLPGSGGSEGGELEVEYSEEVQVLGIIVPTALFVAMFVLLLSTMLVANVSYNLNLSLDSVETTEFRYVSYGAMNELLSDLNAGLDSRTLTKSNPRRIDNGGSITECWVEPIAGGQNVFVTAQTYRNGQSRPEIVKSLCSFQGYPLSRVYTNAIDNDYNTPDPIFYSDVSDSGAWSKLPDAPRTLTNDNGTFQNLPGSAGSLPFVAGGPDGSMYAVYVPQVDEINDAYSPIFFGPIPVPVPMPWGAVVRQTIAAGNQQGLTVGDLAPIEQALVGHVPDVTVSKGATVLKYSQEQGQWNPLPAAQEAIVVNGQVQMQNGNYHLNGVMGPPTAYQGGLIAPLFRGGQDTIYNYSEATSSWNVLKPPGQDVLLMTADTNNGTPFVQTGNLQDVGLDYFLRVLFKDLSLIRPQVSETALHKYVDGQWEDVPNPPAQYFDQAGQRLRDSAYGNRGPSLGGMVASNGDLTVVNHPSGAGLVDTLYKYHEGAWEVVPSPPNHHFDSSGHEIDDPGLAARLEIGMGADGNLILRVPNKDGPNPIFTQTKGGGYDLLPPVRGEGGPLQGFLSQTSGGRKRDGSSQGSFVVRATYF